MATDDKYDRQLRLWGPDGQRRLAESHVLLINATATGTEALKNLILPGIGKFTVADKEKVTPTDHGNNFFVTEEDIGKPRAEVVTHLLAELNPDSHPYCLPNCDANTFISDPKKLEPFNLIIACDITEDEIVLLSKACKQMNKSLLISVSMGLIGYVRIYKPEHLIIESKPTGKIEGDLRLNKPFPELLEFAKTYNLEQLSLKLHEHVPFPVLLLKAKDKWMAENGGILPQNFKEKETFALGLKKMAKDYNVEENFQEAFRNAPLCFTQDMLTEDQHQIFDNPKCVDKKCQEKFWILAGALLNFYKKYGEIPLSGKIPDVTADTTSYLTMQKM